MNILLQSPKDGLCWFSSVIYLLTKCECINSNIDIKKSKLFESIIQLSKAKRLRKFDMRRNRNKNLNFSLKYNWQHQLYVVRCIYDNISMLQFIKPQASHISNIKNVKKIGIPTEYALLCLLKSFKYKVSMNIDFIVNDTICCHEYFNEENVNISIHSIYFDTVCEDVIHFFQKYDTTTFELTVDIGTSDLHSVILTKNLDMWYILDSNRGKTPINELYENGFKDIMYKLLKDEVQKTETDSNEIEMYHDLKGILILI